MAHVLFSSSSYLYSQEEHPAGKIRLSIFLIAGLFGGLPALVWALRVLYGHYKSGGRISALVIMLLLSDLLQLLLSPYVLTVLLQDSHCWRMTWTCHTLTSLWSVLMIYGFHLQQVVALEAALSSRHPPCSAHAFFPICSFIVFIYFLLCEAFRVTLLIVLILPLLLMITLASCIITCRAPTQINNIPNRTRRPSSTVLAFVTSTLILYGTFSSVCAVVYIVPALDHYKYVWNVFVMGVCLMSLNVIIDPLLCVLVCMQIY